MVSAQLSSVPRVLPMSKSKHGEEPEYEDMFSLLNTLERTRCLFFVKILKTVGSLVPRLSLHVNKSDGKLDGAWERG